MVKEYVSSQELTVEDMHAEVGLFLKRNDNNISMEKFVSWLMFCFLAIFYKKSRIFVTDSRSTFFKEAYHYGGEESENNVIHK